MSDFNIEKLKYWGGEPKAVGWASELRPIPKIDPAYQPLAHPSKRFVRNARIALWSLIVLAVLFLFRVI